jgi:hypothetical protein
MFRERNQKDVESGLHDPETVFLFPASLRLFPPTIRQQISFHPHEQKIIYYPPGMMLPDARTYAVA